MAEFEEIDLSQELAMPTEEKDNTPGPDVSEAAPIENKDFAPVENDIVDEVVEEVKESKVMYDSAKLAPVILEVCETLIENFAPHLFFHTLPESDRHALKVLARKVKDSNKTDVTTLTNGDLRIMDLYEDYENYIDTLPLTPEERKSIAEPLKECLKDVNYQTSPGNALLIAIVLVMIPRLLPLGINYTMKK